MNPLISVSHSNSFLNTIPTTCLREALTYLTPKELQKVSTASRTLQIEAVRTANEFRTPLNPFIQNIISQLDLNEHSVHIEALKALQQSLAVPDNSIKLETRALEIESILIPLLRELDENATKKILENQPQLPSFLKRFCPTLTIYWEVIQASQDKNSLKSLIASLKGAIDALNSPSFLSQETNTENLFSNDEALFNTTLENILTLLVQENHFDLAIKAALFLPNKKRDYHLSQIALALKNQSQFTRAIESILLISSQHGSDHCLLNDIAKAFVKQNQPDHAIQTILFIQDRSYRQKCLHGLAITLKRLSQFDHAIKAALLIPDDDASRSFFLSEIAVTLAENGKLDLAIQTVLRTREDLHTIFFEKLANALTSDPNAPQLITNSKESKEVKEKLLSLITKTQIRKSNSRCDIL